jgi:hypothetical protein
LTVWQGKTLSMLCGLLSHHLGLNNETKKAEAQEDDWLALFDNQPKQ